MSDLCWRCHEAEGTILHIFWECAKIKEFWEMVAETIRTITEISLGDRPADFLLLDIPISAERYKNSLLRHLLTAARAYIPVLWKRDIPPTRAQWFARIAENQQMENLTLAMKDKDERYRKTWAPYLAYREGSG